MVSNLRTSQLVEKYRTSGDPGLATEIKKKIGTMPPEEKAVLMAGLKQPAGQAMPEPKTEAFQDGKPVAETTSKVPEVEVESAAVEAPTAIDQAREEIAAGVPKKTVEAEKEVAEVIEAVPAVAEEEEEEATEVAEPATDTAPPSAAKAHDKFTEPSNGKPEADTADAVALERTLAYNPEKGDMVEQ